MKLSGKKIRHKLLESDNPAILFLGLVTPEPDYKTSLLLNSALGTRFHSKPSLVRAAAENPECSFSRFSSGSEYNDTSYELVRNRNKKCVIDKKFSSLDYLLIIKGDEIADTRDYLVTRIRGIREISAVFVLDDNIAIAYSILQQIG